MIKIRWFKNNHEQRNYWLRFGLMRLHRAGAINYREYPLSRCVEGGFSEAVADHEHRHTSVISVETGGESVRCIVDSEDSFLVMHGLIEHADVYFCAGYNSQFFKEQRFAPPYSWFEPFEVQAYATKAAELVNNYGKWFSRARPFVPICPSLSPAVQLSFPELKMRNALEKISRRLRESEPWFNAHHSFELRYRSLLARRNAPANYDVVLLDTLWGWPRHRYALHQRLRELGEAGFNIHARLNWSEPSGWDGSSLAPLERGLFPMSTGQVVDYERMLAESRLAVFATGFHWGWRSIMTLTLMWGLPTLADRLLVEPWFDMSRFDLMWNEGTDWRSLRSTLESVTDAKRSSIQEQNQRAFDELLSPEKVAEYFVATALAGDSWVVPSGCGRLLSRDGLVPQ